MKGEILFALYFYICGKYRKIGNFLHSETNHIYILYFHFTNLLGEGLSILFSPLIERPFHAGCVLSLDFHE